MQTDALIQPGHGHLITSRGLLAGKMFSHLTGRQKCALCDGECRRDILWEQGGHPTGAGLILQLPKVAAISLQDALIQDHQQLLRGSKNQSSWRMKHPLMVVNANGVCWG